MGASLLLERSGAIATRPPHGRNEVIHAVAPGYEWPTGGTVLRNTAPSFF